MELSKKANEIKERYSRNSITDQQLEKYKKLGVINEEEFTDIKNIKEELS